LGGVVRVSLAEAHAAMRLVVVHVHAQVVVLESADRRRVDALACAGLTESRRKKNFKRRTRSQQSARRTHAQTHRLPIMVMILENAVSGERDISAAASLPVAKPPQATTHRTRVSRAPHPLQINTDAPHRRSAGPCRR